MSEGAPVPQPPPAGPPRPPGARPAPGQPRRQASLPDDARGRVEFIAVTVPPPGDSLPYEATGPPAAPLRRPAFDAVHAGVEAPTLARRPRLQLPAFLDFSAAGASGWLPVGLLAVLLIAVFVIGRLIAR